MARSIHNVHAGARLRSRVYITISKAQSLGPTLEHEIFLLFILNL